MELLVFWLICAVVTAIIASSKGRSGFGWFLIGAVIGVFGIILIACLPSLAEEKPAPIDRRFPAASEKTKRCTDCAETVLSAAKVCKHCGYRFA
ncbi:hypothetical protein [Citreimonas sp.]|uniref:hypothetical protein n=1 Tax=Citreimonas sp. TaxID=3036715 RepID=UPI00405A00D7